MTQKELAERIIGSFTDKEWELLAQNQMDIPVSEWNRQTLLELRRSKQAFQKEISPEDVNLLSDSIYDYLAEVWILFYRGF